MNGFSKVTILFIIMVFSLLLFIPLQRASAAVNCDDPLVICKSGTISDETWSPPAVYVIIDELIVPTDVTLTIEAGTIIKIVAQHVRITVDGTLNANGTSGSKVYFTSSRDDSLGGNTDGEDIPPAPGNWNQIYFRNGSSGSLNYTELRYGGSYGAMLYMDPDTGVTVDHGTFKNSYSCAISSDPGYEPTLTNMSPTDFTGSFYNGICMRSGGINNNATWDETEAAYILEDDITVTSGFTLTLSIGVVVKPLASHVELLVDGTLNANGTSGSRVYFTSLNDDSLGGQTNNNPNPPAPGHWGRIYFRNGSSGSLNYTELRYGGSYGAMLYMDPDTGVTVDHGTFKNSYSCAISSDPGYEPTLTNMSPTDFTGSFYNGICMRSGGISNNATWDETEAAYILEDDITVTSGFTLVLSPGVVVKPLASHVELLVDGTLNANGTSGSRVYFTSLNDDSLGGQTNNNPNPPAPGHWGRIYFRNGSSGSLNYTELRYGGAYSAVYSENASPQLNQCVLWNNIIGLSSYGASGNPTIHNCEIYDNTQYGVYNGESGYWIDATNNYWGSSSGPYDPSPPGTDGSYNYGSGDQVNDYVQYNPWVSHIDYYEVFLPFANR